MDITVYLPDEIGQRAKQRELNLSRLLREAVTEELIHREALDRTIAGADQQIQLEVEDEEGRNYAVRFTGTQIGRGQGYTLGQDCAGNAAPYELYLVEDGRVILYDETSYSVLEDPTVFRPDDDGEYVEIMRALGLKAVVDL